MRSKGCVLQKTAEQQHMGKSQETLLNREQQIREGVKDSLSKCLENPSLKKTELKELYRKVNEHCFNWTDVSKHFNSLPPSFLRREIAELVRTAFKKMAVLLNNSVTSNDVDLLEEKILVGFLQQVTIDKEVTYKGRKVNLVNFMEDFAFMTLNDLKTTKDEVELKLTDFILSKLVCYQQEKLIKQKKIRKKRETSLIEKRKKTKDKRTLLKKSFQNMRAIVTSIDEKKKKGFDKYELVLYLTQAINSSLDIEFAFEYFRKDCYDRELFEEFTNIFSKLISAMGDLGEAKFRDMVCNIETLFEKSDEED